MKGNLLCPVLKTSRWGDLPAEFNLALLFSNEHRFSQQARLWIPSSFSIFGFCMYDCAYNSQMAYQWDREKAVTNLRKHGIDFADAVSVFSDDLAITTPDERFDEERFITIGLDALGRVLVVVYTWRGQKIRLISARSATRQERRQYEEG
jgi:uncharacterized protein